MRDIGCPVENCPGGETSSGHPNPMNHVKNKAKSELLTKHIIGKGRTIHADWLKNNLKPEKPTKVLYSIGKHKFSIG